MIWAGVPQVPRQGGGGHVAQGNPRVLHWLWQRESDWAQLPPPLPSPHSLSPRLIWQYCLSCNAVASYKNYQNIENFELKVRHKITFSPDSWNINGLKVNLHWKIYSITIMIVIMITIMIVLTICYYAILQTTALL